MEEPQAQMTDKLGKLIRAMGALKKDGGAARLDCEWAPGCTHRVSADRIGGCEHEPKPRARARVANSLGTCRAAVWAGPPRRDRPDAVQGNDTAAECAKSTNSACPVDKPGKTVEVIHRIHRNGRPLEVRQRSSALAMLCALVEEALGLAMLWGKCRKLRRPTRIHSSLVHETIQMNDL